MKTFFQFLILLLIGLGVTAWLNPELVTWVRNKTGTESKSVVYKWQDKEGNWHVTDKPPPSGVTYQEQEYLHDVNVLPALEKKEK